MTNARDTRFNRKRRHLRVREKTSGTAEKPRLCVFRSTNHIYAQVIDDVLGQTLTSASTLDPAIKAEGQAKDKTEKAKLVGVLVGKRSLDKDIGEVVFDRGGYKYHGRVKALADAARATGLRL